LTSIGTCGGEELLISAHGAETVCLTITEPRFGSVARVRLEHHQAAALANALDQHLVDATDGIPAGSEG
jgi:hypothetical protein